VIILGVSVDRFENSREEMKLLFTPQRMTVNLTARTERVDIDLVLSKMARFRLEIFQHMLPISDRNIARDRSMRRSLSKSRP
jgi:hypothetical protein